MSGGPVEKNPVRDVWVGWLFQPAEKTSPLCVKTSALWVIWNFSAFLWHFIGPFEIFLDPFDFFFLQMLFDTTGTDRDSCLRGWLPDLSESLVIFGYPGDISGRHVGIPKIRGCRVVLGWSENFCISSISGGWVGWSLHKNLLTWRTKLLHTGPPALAGSNSIFHVQGHVPLC